MICEFCGGTTEKRIVKKQHWLHGNLYIVENVEAQVCKECGERYFHALTLDAIDRLLESEHEIKEKLQVEVVSV
jgi:YgiT-type zinc finger domain-containing protein